jgi:uncharacterized protein (TIGR03083 family)
MYTVVVVVVGGGAVVVVVGGGRGGRVVTGGTEVVVLDDAGIDACEAVQALAMIAAATTSAGKRRDIGVTVPPRPGFRPCQPFLASPWTAGSQVGGPWSSVYSVRMRDAATVLLVESEAIRPILASLEPEAFGYETVCTGWSVRDVLAHCGAALSMAATDALHGFSPSENEVDVQERRSWPIERVLDELFDGYAIAVLEIEKADGGLDGLGLGEWMHGGDVRDAVGAPDPYTSDGADLAFDLLLDRSAANYRPQSQTSQAAVAGKPRLDILVDGLERRFGGLGDAVGSLTTDVETFIRLCGGRRPDPARFVLTGAKPSELTLFG